MKGSRCLLFLLMMAVPAGAETLPLSLGDAVERALHEGARAQLARSAEVRARIATVEALENLLPQGEINLLRYNQSLNLETFGLTLPGFPIVVPPFNVTDVQIEAAMQLFNLAALRHYQAANQGERASRYVTEQTENDVAAAVARLYVLAQRAASQVSSREADIELFQRLLQTAQDEFNAGTGTRLDVAQATVQVDRARQSLLLAQNDERTALLALLNVIGADEGADVTLTDPLPVVPSPPSLEIELQAAQRQRPELKAMDAREKSASLGLSAARSRRIPSLGFDFTGDWSGNRSSDLLWTRRIAAVFTMPLFHADIEAAAARARADMHDVEIEHAQLQRDIGRDVRRALMDVENANARVAVATENAQLAEEALTVARDRRASGFGSPVEVDRAQDSWRQAREDLISAQADAAAAQYDLEHATGDIRRLVEGKP